MKLLVLGTSSFAQRCAEGLLDGGHDVCAIVSLPRGPRPLNAADLGAFAVARSIPYREFEDMMLKPPALEVARRFAIGTHPTALPFNRGRHPLHWPLVLGIAETRLTFFNMDEGVDTGRILLQVPFAIGSRGTIVDALQEYGGGRLRADAARHYAGLLLSELPAIRPVDGAISWVIGRDRLRAEMRFPALRSRFAMVHTIRKEVHPRQGDQVRQRPREAGPQLEEQHGDCLLSGPDQPLENVDRVLAVLAEFGCSK